MQCCAHERRTAGIFKEDNNFLSSLFQRDELLALPDLTAQAAKDLEVYTIMLALAKLFRRSSCHVT
jgi:hypothetical protein